MPNSPSLLKAQLKGLLHKIHCIEDSILALLLFGMIVLSTSQIFLRNIFDSGIIWADPLLRVMVLWIGLLGALAATSSKPVTTRGLRRACGLAMATTLCRALPAATCCMVGVATTNCAAARTLTTSMAATATIGCTVATGAT